jgi:CheY-like chemotaxis protein
MHIGPGHTDPALYDAIALGLGRSAKDNLKLITDAVSNLGDAISKLVIYAPDPNALDGAHSKFPGLKDLRRADNVAQFAQLIADMLPDGEMPTVQHNGMGSTEFPSLAGAKVLIVDDDIRNIYSLTSVLETYDIEVLHAERGQDGIDILEQAGDGEVDVALIDIMMPEMDGYETMREIRRRPALADLPLIAVTAKAMKGDRKKCLEAGASDYIAKPVDLDLLLALLRVWVARSRSRAVAQETTPVVAVK